MSQESLWALVRRSIIGAGAVVETCFGARRIVYADYTASGRAVSLIEDYLARALEEYANTHTEDDATGRATTERLAAAERSIKRLLGAGEDYALIMTGAGTTGAVERLQQILGVYVAPASRDRARREMESVLGARDARSLEESSRALRPVVFVGPYEHHSNELSWREADAEVVEIELDADGLLDLTDLERKASAPEYAARRRIGAFSACSNVTGLLSPVEEVARILHRHRCLAVFDLAAVAPYRRIEVCRDAESRFDAAYLSPHKLVGGPGSAGMLLIQRELYRSDLPPSFAGGGTVDFVSWTTQDYVEDLETREKAGTPGILQTLRAALALELKEELGIEAIEGRERRVTRHVLERLGRLPEVWILGNPDPDRRIGIVSFVVRSGDEFIHPRFVTQLLNDLFGIQSRAGCMCAGPYGHRLLGIDRERSETLRAAIHRRRAGLRPGWTRVTFHYLASDDEIDFLCDAIGFVASEAKWFLPLYEFREETGAWKRLGWEPPDVRFGIQEAISGGDAALGASPPRDAPDPTACLVEARSLAAGLRASFDPNCLKTTDRALFPFLYAGT